MTRSTAIYWKMDSTLAMEEGENSQVTLVNLLDTVRGVKALTVLSIMDLLYVIREMV